MLAAMIDLYKLIWCAVAGLFRSRAALEAEILVLRHQLNVLRRKSPGRLAFSSIDRLVFAGMYALAPNILDCRDALAASRQSQLRIDVTSSDAVGLGDRTRARCST